MILSMTGFGDAVLEEGPHRYHLEIRSVNNRYFKVIARLSEQFAFLEAEVEKHLRNHLARGSITVHLYVRTLGAEAALDLNTAAIQRYAERLRDIAGDDPRFTVDLSVLATLPGVCEPHELTEREREDAWRIVSGLLDKAVENLMTMRREEGKSLAADLLKHCQVVAENARAVRQRAPLVVQEYQKRLHSRINELLHNRGVSLAEEDLVREVGIYAERSDISEELNRLESHLEQFRSAIASGEPAGRKLDFISQEMLREANTIGSKAADADIARHTVEMKGAIDRLKEQVQNAE